MQSKIKTISITLHEEEARQVVNALLVGLRDQEFSIDSDEFAAAHKLKDLLITNFQSQVTGIHTPRQL
ncbi:MAG: hypothetical protein ACMZ64_09230 [Oleiphilus sp.]